ncbi:MAG: ABC transporter permease [Cellulomonadaceae bacterium]|jgi:peptide/nickel transport system permease protein|nr:ABC transporter permease [Cellulomonadaceae bacterium]
MTTYFLRALGKLLGTLLIASVLIFLILRVMPGDAATVALGINATPDALEAWREAHGTNSPLIAQYVTWMGGILHLDFGTSFVTGRALTPLILDRVQVTLIIVGLGMVLALLAAIPLGTLAAVKHRSPLGVGIAGASQIGVALPSFLVGVLLVGLFAVRLGWLPSGGWMPPAYDFSEFLRRVTLPVLALATVQTAVMTRYIRSAVLEVMREDFLRTARAGGSTWNRALVRHGLRNAAVPIVTVVGVQLASMLIGAVVIERVFVVPGIGSMLVDAVGQRDLQAVQGIVMVLVTIVVVLNIAVDLLYMVLDPRIRLRESS